MDQSGRFIQVCGTEVSGSLGYWEKKMDQPLRTGAWVTLTNVYRVLFALLSAGVGLALAYGGGQLLALGGSAYYLLAGLAYIGLAALFFLRKSSALPASVAVFAATCVWALYDTPHIGYWELLPRLVVPAILLALGRRAPA